MAKKDTGYRRPYLDSSVYIAAIKNEVVNGVDRGQIARDILMDAQKGSLQVVASTALIAEVIRAKDSPQLDEDQEALIDAYLFQEFITWVEVDIVLAKEARRLARQHNLKPFDAIHLASAIRGKADCLLRWDGRFVGEGTVIEEVTVCEPYWHGQMQM